MAARQQLYKVAVQMIASRGYEATTLREIAKKADVSVGLLYRYFPSKRAVVLAMYDDLSAAYAARASKMGPGPWRDRFLFALRNSLGVLGHQRASLTALTPVLVGDANQGLFAHATEASRRRVQAVFHEAVVGASDAPMPEEAAALGRVLYVAHLVVILWWLLDKSRRQRATTELVAMIERVLPVASLALALPSAGVFLHTADRLCRDGLFGGSD